MRNFFVWRAIAFGLFLASTGGAQSIQNAAFVNSASFYTASNGAKGYGVINGGASGFSSGSARLLASGSVPGNNGGGGTGGGGTFGSPTPGSFGGAGPLPFGGGGGGGGGGCDLGGRTGGGTLLLWAFALALVGRRRLGRLTA